MKNIIIAYTGLKAILTDENISHTKDTLTKLTLPNGQMARALRLGNTFKHQVDVLLAMKKNDAGSLETIGWLTADHGEAGYVRIQLFVDEVHRRFGVGTELLREARERYYPDRKLCVTAHDNISADFFEKVGASDHLICIDGRN